MKGADAEARAAKYLEAQGRTLLAQNYRIKGGEIDLVSREASGTLVFTEVRHRSHADFGQAAETITAQKLALMQRAAQQYLIRELGHENILCRLEVITIDGPVESGQLQIFEV